MPDFPDPKTMTAEELAQTIADNQELLEWAYTLRRQGNDRLKPIIKDHGPIQLADGKKLTMSSGGYIYQDEMVAAEFPALVKSSKLTVTGPPTAVQRAEDMVAEEFGDQLARESGFVIDKAECLRIVRLKGEAGKRLEELREPQGSLVVTT